MKNRWRSGGNLTWLWKTLAVGTVLALVRIGWVVMMDGM